MTWSRFFLHVKGHKIDKKTKKNNLWERDSAEKGKKIAVKMKRQSNGGIDFRFYAKICTKMVNGGMG